MRTQTPKLIWLWLYLQRHYPKPSKMTDSTKNTAQCCCCDVKFEYEDLEELDEAGWVESRMYGSVCDQCVDTGYYRPCGECGLYHHDIDLRLYEDPDTEDLADEELCDDCLDTREKQQKND
jgi:hypothetical protein